MEWPSISLLRVFQVDSTERLVVKFLGPRAYANICEGKCALVLCTCHSLLFNLIYHEICTTTFNDNAQRGLVHQNYLLGYYSQPKHSVLSGNFRTTTEKWANSIREFRVFFSPAAIILPRTIIREMLILPPKRDKNPIHYIHLHFIFWVFGITRHKTQKHN